MCRWSIRSHGRPAEAIDGIRARSLTCPGEPQEYPPSRRPWPSGLISAKLPFAGRPPHRVAFARPSSPRPWGEMASFRRGVVRGRYHRGSTTQTPRRAPVCDRYAKCHRVTCPRFTDVVVDFSGGPAAASAEGATSRARATTARALARKGHLDGERAAASREVDRAGSAIERPHGAPADRDRRDPRAAG